MQIIVNKRITQPMFHEDDGLRIEGDYAIIRNVLIDFAEVPLSDQDEALSFTQNPTISCRNVVLQNVGKAFLCGRGDEESILGGTVHLDHCIIRNFGRRGPEAQDKIKIRMTNCLIENWGDPKYFTVRNFGAWAHHGGEIHCENCIFIQKGSIFKGGLVKFFIDLANHIGISFNYGSRKLADYLLPGVCRGLTAGKFGNVSAKNCYKNRWWIRLENSVGKMTEEEKDQLLAELESVLV